jgi:hypothetical protein
VNAYAIEARDYNNISPYITEELHVKIDDTSFTKAKIKDISERIDRLELSLEKVTAIKEGIEKLSYALSWVGTTYKVTRWVAAAAVGVAFLYKEISPYIIEESVDY